MGTNNEKRYLTRATAMILAVIMVVSMLPASMLTVFAEEETDVLAAPIVELTIGDSVDGQYTSIAAAITAAGTAKAKLKLIGDSDVIETPGFDVGSSNGETPQNIELDMNGKSLVFNDSIGSEGTRTSGIRVLYKSTLDITDSSANGANSITAACAEITRVISNYGTLRIEKVDVVASDSTQYIINNRGALTLLGPANILDGTGANFKAAITNDPYNMYCGDDYNAKLTIKNASVGTIQAERYARDYNKNGIIEIIAESGTYGPIIEDGNGDVNVSYTVNGGKYRVGDSEQLARAIKAIKGTNNVKIIVTADIEEAGFNVGNETGTEPQNITLDLNKHKITLKPPVGSTGTVTNGIRVLAKSSLNIINGKIITPDNENVKVGIANYGTLVLEDVEMTAGKDILYTINNRGNLTLKGKTIVPDNNNHPEKKFVAAITNDPYDLVYTSAFNAVLNVPTDNDDVKIGKILVERYNRTTPYNPGAKIQIQISAGEFEEIREDGGEGVNVEYTYAPGMTVRVPGKDLQDAIDAAPAFDADKPYTIVLTSDAEYGFDVGNSDGTVPKNICLDLNGHELTLKPPVGSAGTVTNGIRVLANSRLTIKNGKLICPDECEEGKKVKVGIANYSELVLENVEMVAGKEILYTINNRGNLTLLGNTTVPNNDNHPEGKFEAAITNDPYDLVYTTAENAVLNVPAGNDNVKVGKVLIERYARKNHAINPGAEIVLSINAGQFGEIAEDGKDAVSVKGKITGGTFASENVKDYCILGYEANESEDKWTVTKIDGHGLELNVEDTSFTLNSDASTDTVYSRVSAKNKTGMPIVFSIEGTDGNPTDIATIDSVTGSITAKKMGQVYVVATCAAYQDGEGVNLDLDVKKQLITINGADRDIELTKTVHNLYTGAYEYDDKVNNPAPVAKTKKSYPGTTPKFVYEVAEDIEGIVAAINPENGHLELYDCPGTVKVKVTLESDGYYAEQSATFDVVVRDWEPEEGTTLYNITGEQKNPESGWYTGPVTISAADGYELAYPCEENEVYDWRTELDVITDDGENHVKFFVRDTNDGYITSAYDETIKIDKNLPTAKIKVGNHETWGKFLTIITLGLWDSETLTCELVEEADVSTEKENAQTSGFASVTYYVDYANIERTLSEAELDEITEFESNPTINKDEKFVVYAKLYDNAGNRNYIATNGVVFDRTAPVVEEIDIIEGNVYTEAVEFDVRVTDDASGIKEVTYTVECDNEVAVTDNKPNLYNFDIVDPKFEDLVLDVTTRKAVIPVSDDGSVVNSGLITLTVNVTDNAGNTTTETYNFEIDAIKPKIEVVYNDTTNEFSKPGYVQGREATITVTERNFEDGIKTLVIKDINGDDVNCGEIKWEHVDGTSGNSTQHRATVIFNPNVEYGEFAVEVTDATGKNTSTWEAVDEIEPREEAPIFVVDSSEPVPTLTATLYDDKGSVKTTYEWDKLVEVLTHSIFDNKPITINCAYNDTDDLSPVNSIHYYTTDSTDALTEDILKSGEIEWIEYDGSVDADCSNIYTYYFRIVDVAGNVKYISTNGFILEDNAPALDIVLEDPGVERTVEGMEDTIYVYPSTYFNAERNSLKFNVNTNEPEGEIYSGLKSVEYKITCDDTVITADENNPEGLVTKWAFDEVNPTYNKLVTVKNKEISIPVIDADGNPINNGIITVYAKVTDNSGNSTEKTVTFEIDTIAPVISIDNVDVTEEGVYEANPTVGFYNNVQTVVTVNERNFVANSETTKITVKAYDIEGNEIEDTEGMYEISDWYTTLEGDSIVNKAVITYLADGNFDVSVETADIATNSADLTISDENGDHPGAFTRDITAPMGEVYVDEIGEEVSKWEQFFTTITFGLWSNKEEGINVKAKRNDVTSPVQEISYFVSNSTEYDENWLSIAEWTMFTNSDYSDNVSKAVDFDTVFEKPITPDSREVVYVRIVDCAGNVTYINTDGIIVEVTEPETTVNFDPEYVGENAADDNHPIYDGDVDALITITDKIPEKDENGNNVLDENGNVVYKAYSGIKSAYYWIECDGEITSYIDPVEPETPAESETPENGDEVVAEREYKHVIYTAEYDTETGVSFGQLKDIIENYPITIPADNNNGDVVVKVEVSDNAGNTILYTSDVIEIDTIEPLMTLEYSDNTAPVGKDKNGAFVYKTGFAQYRQATITVVEREDHFEAENFKLVINAANKDGSVPSNTNGKALYVVNDFELDPDKSNTFVATVDFNGSANYEYTIEYADKAGNPLVYEYEGTKLLNSVSSGKYETVDENGDDQYYDFTVDTVAPTAILKAQLKKDKTITTWEKVAKTLSFGWVKASSDFSITAPQDLVSNVMPTCYAVVDEATAKDAVKLTGDEAIAFYESDKFVWETYNGGDITISRAKEVGYVVFVKVIDFAGNTTYISSDGHRVDGQAPVFNELSINISLSKSHGEYYTGDYVVYDVTVEDLGIVASDNNTASGLKSVTYEVYCGDKMTQSGPLLKEENIGDVKLTTQINVRSKDSERNNVYVVVKAQDLADNVGVKNTKNTPIKIDVTKPEVNVSVSGQKNPLDQNYPESTYFNDANGREVTIEVKEYNFDANNVIITLKKDNNTLNINPTFNRIVDDYHNTVYKATFKLTDDGVYDLSVDFTDKAGHKPESIVYSGVTPEHFTIDTTPPEVNVSFNNMNVENGMYYKDARVATITVRERNFDSAKFELVEGKLNASDWSHSSDGLVHTAKITYKDNGTYTFGYSFFDKAGNESNKRNPEKEKFTIDKVKPTIEIDKDNGAGDGKQSYKDDVSILVEVNDETAIDKFRYTVELTNRDNTDFDFKVPELTLENSDKNGTITINDFSSDRDLPDGIYDLKVTVYDMAGNSASNTKIISVNRDSSNYLLGEYTEKIVNKKYITKIDGDVVISEVNCDEIKNTKITVIRDGQSEILDEKLYKISSTKRSGDWNEYTYTIDASVFEKDGNYTILIESEDGAGNKISNLSAIEGYRKEITFAVDDTKPTVILSGLDDGPYDAKYVDAVLSFEDNIGVATILIERFDKDTLIDDYEVVVSNEDLNAISDEYIAKVSEYGNAQTIKITVTDHADNETVIEKTVTVSTNWLTRFLNDSVQLGITIGAVVVIAAAAIIIPVLLKKKKKNAADAAK